MYQQSVSSRLWKDYWDIKDIELRFVYANKVAFDISCLSMNFDVEVRLASECPLSWGEYADTIDSHEQIVY
ncbi:MAG: hypothetical protein ACL7BU_01990 [Candidatus Phlomobacter fragariae]